MWLRYSSPETPDGALVIRRSARARRMLLRIDPRSGAVVLTLPPRVPEAEGLAFVRRQRAWIDRTRAALPPAVVFEPGAEVPLLGIPRTIDFSPGWPRRAALDDEGLTVRVGGEASEVANRVRRFLRSEAAATLGPKVKTLAPQVTKAAVRIRIGDPQSRWGSCSTTGTISLSWRLIMAPEWVIDYVVAHEVAHLREMNHSARFWRLVARLDGNADQARAWLRHYGPGLQRAG